MNYYYRPEVAAQVAAYVNYVCPVQGAQEVMAKEDPELAESPLDLPDGRDSSATQHPGFPGSDPARGCRVFRHLGRR
jgi:spermidine/putrescine transport system substrate-binding protein